MSYDIELRHSKLSMANESHIKFITIMILCYVHGSLQNTENMVHTQNLTLSTVSLSIQFESKIKNNSIEIFASEGDIGLKKEFL